MLADRSEPRAALGRGDKERGDHRLDPDLHAIVIRHVDRIMDDQAGLTMDLLENFAWYPQASDLIIPIDSNHDKNKDPNLGIPNLPS